MSTADQLTALNAGYATIGALIPNKYNFTDELSTSQVSISDGGNDMYDNANVLNTNRTNAYATVKTNGFNSRLATSIPYTHTKHINTIFSFNGNGTVNSGTTYFGSGSTYFTNLYPGFFVLVANDISITEFSITGNIGVDGSGTLATHDFSVVVGSNTYSVYRKMISGTTDPSINHFIIIPGSGTGVTHSWDTSKQYDDDVIQGLTGITSLYYILAARSSGQVISNTDATNIATTFLQTLGNLASPSSSQTISGTSITTSESFNSNIVKQRINLTSSITTAESFNSNIFKQRINLTSILSSESFEINKLNQNVNLSSVSSSEIFGNNSIKHTIILPTSISSNESFNSNIIKQKLNLASIFEEEFGNLKLNQNISAPTSIVASEIVLSPHVKLTINNSDLLSLESFGNNRLLQNVTFLEASAVLSKETFEIPDVQQYIFVTESPFCQTKADYLDCLDYKRLSAVVPAITIVRQKLYLKNKMPIQERNRRGFYVKIN